MEQKSYHHGSLQTELIEEGLALIHEEGIRNFSLRRLAKRVGVTPTACYNHYKGIDDLLVAIQTYVTNKFSLRLRECMTGKNPSEDMERMGIAYVIFFLENPTYFTFIYDNSNYEIKLDEMGFQSDFEPFKIFEEAGSKMLDERGIPKEQQKDYLLMMWTVVHGLAAMANMKGFHYSGDWESLVGNMLRAQCIFWE
ncbi:MAG: TetR/AcrR family transcriptional regulator [Clostridiales bacterium]|nr:TetR/AcrR family transcriptional regulator [Clostridiales bacterium]